MAKIITDDEEGRLRELKRLRILDTGREQVFEDFAELATQVSNSKLANIALIDEERLWFKSHVSMDLNEMPRKGSFSEDVLQRPELHYIEDASIHPDHKNHPYVKGPPYLRFFASAPLVTKAGYVIGVLSVLDYQPRTLGENHKRALTILARQIVMQMEYRLLMQSAQLSAEIVRSSPAAIFCKEYALKDNENYEDGVFVEWNPAAEKMLGVSKETVQGKTDYDFFSDEEAGRYRDNDLDVFKKGETVFIEREEVTSLEGTRVFRTWKTPLQDPENHSRYILAMSLDITRQEKLEQALLEAKKAAEEAALTKAAFLANMSHEIRTPMNGVLGMTTLLLETLNDPVHLEKLGIIQNSCNDLLDIVNNILDFSRLEASKVELEKRNFPLRSSLQELVKMHKAMAESKGLSVDISFEETVPEWITGDETRLRQILNNLAGNAVKFTEKGSVSISVVNISESQESAFIEVTVSDTGPGISEEMQEKLFRDFAQVDASVARRYGGSGLGLAITKGLCEMMGGSIRIESKLGQGSRFIFTFEAARALAVANQLESESLNVEFDDLKVLVADDNEVNRLVAVGMLAQFGLKADQAEDGVEVLEKIYSDSYDVVLMDCNMPELDGYSVTRVIREKENAQGKKLVIIAVTASTMPDEIEMCYASGMDFFLAKPLKKELLHKALKDTLELKCSSSDVLRQVG